MISGTRRNCDRPHTAPILPDAYKPAFLLRRIPGNRTPVAESPPDAITRPSGPTPRGEGSGDWGAPPASPNRGLGRLGRHGGRGVFQGPAQDLTDVLGEVEGHRLPHRFGHVVEVGAVAGREDHRGEPGPVGG